MNSKNSLIALGIGVAFGGLAFFLLYQKASEIAQKTTPVEVLVASRYISPGNFLKADMVGKKTVPEAFVGPSAIRDIKEVEGLTTLAPISEGEQILANKFGAGEESLAFTLNSGYRAYTLEVNETSGVGGLLRPGNHVDVLTKTESDKRQVTSFVFQNLEILAVGQRLNFRRKEKNGQDSSSSGNTSSEASYSTVTLAVTPEQAETLMYLDGNPLRLVLRAPSDNDIVSTSPQNESEVMSKLGHFTAKTKNIEIIRGNSKQGE